MGASQPRELIGEAMLLAAGVADVAVSGLGQVLAQGRALLGGGDVVGLAGEGHREIRARGKVVLDRFALEPAYLETLARHVAARGDRTDG
ncbi:MULTISPECIES: hypothetical protein [Streptomyces]|uniref:hypothetical protein n=1 Tax=Streptomyces TaxID=1883 RepID=UPI00136ED082|nr:hypothetical protein [Streptomyces sp. SID2888]MYV46045.1 hypothetical protein [Streptomyces sp. SID2888]